MDPRPRKTLFILISVFAMLLLFGCADQMFQYANDYTATLNPGTELNLFDFNKMEQCGQGTCICMVCDSYRPLWQDILIELKTQLGWDEKDLVPWRALDGNCKFEKDCNENEFIDYTIQDDIEIRTFMIGQGPTFMDFNNANPYCKDRLNLAVKWLTSKHKSSYEMPKSDRAECFLGYGVMPLYILYSEGKNIDATRAGEIAQELSDIGPAIITTEIDFDSSKTDVLNKVSQQIEKMHAACSVHPDRQCMVALAPKMGDESGVKKLFDKYPGLVDKVDLFVFGINTRYSNAECNNPSALFLDASNFSATLLYKYGKPSLIGYIMIEPGGTNLAGSANPATACEWTPDDVAKAYTEFFAYAIPTLLKKGVIGAALYNFGSPEDPLKCGPECRVYADLTQPKPEDDPNYPYMQSWFGMCQKYKMDVANTPRGDMFVVFPSESGGSCGFAFNPQSLANMEFMTTGVGTGPDFLDISAPIPDAASDTFFRCEACMNNDTTWPEDLDVPVSTASPPADVCTKYPELDYYADMRDLDPMVVRAIAWTETSFDKCSVSQVTISKGMAQLTNIPGEEETVNNQPVLKPMVTDPNIKDAGAKDACTISPAAAGKKFKAYGLMQTIVFPGEIFKHYDELAVTPAQLGQDWENDPWLLACFDDAFTFNPFNTEHSACVGTAEYSHYLETWLTRVRTNAAALNALDEKGQVDENKVRIIANYLAANSYNWGPGAVSWVFYGQAAKDSPCPNEDSWLETFSAQKDYKEKDCEGGSAPDYCSGGKLKPCNGEKNFIKYVEECRIKTNTPDCINVKASETYGHIVLSRYRALSEKICKPLGLVGCPPTTYIKDQVESQDEDNKIAELPETTPP